MAQSVKEQEDLHYEDEQLRTILKTTQTIAMIGASAKETKPSYFALKYLLKKGYSIIPVNPAYAGQKILNQLTYKQLNDIPGSIDMVEVFRSSDVIKPIIKEIIAIRSQKKIKVIWLQLGVWDFKAAELAENSGLTVIMDRCPKIEYGRLFGELGWIGVNTGCISSKRRRINL